MKFSNRILSALLVVFSTLIIFSSCDKSNSSLKLPGIMEYVQSNNWRIDTVLIESETGENTVYNMGNTPGFVTSSIKFYNNSDTSFVFEDSDYPSLLGPDGSTDLFVYSYGKWSLNKTQDSIALYSTYVKATDSTYYSANWNILDTTQNRLIISYVDTIPMTRTTVSKRIIFAKNTFQ